MRWLLAVGLTLAMVGTAGAEEARVEAGIDRERALVGERMRYTVRVDCPSGWTPVLPELGMRVGQRTDGDAPGPAVDSAEAGSLVVEASGVRPPRAERGGVAQEAWWQLAAYQAGAYTLPPVSASCHAPDGQAVSGVGQPMSVTVASVLPAETAGLDIKAPKPLIRRLSVWFGLLLAAAAAGGIAAWALTRRRPVQTAPRQSPAAIARHALRELQRAQLPEQGRHDDYYQRLSAIVRRYVEAEFGLRAPEMTTEEFLQEAARSAALSVSHRQLMRQFLEQSDLVKFARYQPSRTEADEAFAAAERFLNETQPTSGPAAAAPSTAGVSPVEPPDEGSAPAGASSSDASNGATRR
jgi:hypothetical protein